MSVPKDKRTKSGIEYFNNAYIVSENVIKYDLVHKSRKG